MTRRKAATAAAVATLLAFAASPATAQLNSGCLYLTGSSACPGFEGSYVNVDDLTSQWSFLSRVYDIQDFDRYALQYINNVAKTKLDDQFGCNDASTTVLRYERTVLCARWTSDPLSLQCATQLLGSTTGTKKICSTTCEQNYQSMQDIASNSTICGKDNTGGDRDTAVSTDYAACTAVASSTAATCVSGDMNEHNCGYGNSSTQVCSFCSTTPEKCCTEPNFDISGLCQLDATSLSSSAAANTATGSSGASRSGSKKSGISGGAIAGIVIGVVGGIALIALLAFCLWRRKRKNDKSGSRLLTSPTEKNNHGWGKSSPEATAQHVPEATNTAAVAADPPIARQHSSPTVAAGPLTAQALPTRGPASAGVVPGGVAAGPNVPPKAGGTFAGSNSAAAPSAPVHSTPGVAPTGSHHGGALAGAAAAGAAVAGAGALAAGKHRRDAPSPPRAKRNVSPPVPITASHQPMPQPHPSTTPTAAAFPHVPSSPPRPLPTPPTNMSPTSAFSHASPPRAMPSGPAPQAALAAPAQAASSQANFTAAPPSAAPSGSANMAGVGAGAAAAAAASAAAGSDSTRLPRLELPKGSGVWIEEGSHVIAQHPYNAALVDELTLEPGMRIVVQEIYDDGWARGVVSAGGDPNQHGRVGQFPTVCVTKA